MGLFVGEFNIIVNKENNLLSNRNFYSLSFLITALFLIINKVIRLKTILVRFQNLIHFFMILNTKLQFLC